MSQDLFIDSRSLKRRRRRRGPKSKNTLSSHYFAGRFLPRRQESGLTDPLSRSPLFGGAMKGKDARRVYLSINGQLEAYSPERFSDLMSTSNQPVSYTDQLLYRNPERFFPGSILKPVGPQVTEDAPLPVYLMKVNKEVGWGAFALRDIQKGEVIGEYVGVVTELVEGNAYTMFSSLLPEGFCIDATHFGNEMRYVNHSENPNCEFRESRCPAGQARMIFVATQPISKDQQLLTHYGDAYWQGKKPKSL